MKRFALVFGAVCLLIAPAAWAAQDVVNTRHNLSVSGPGTIKSAAVQEVCVFCHTPHNAVPSTPLWNRPDTLGGYPPEDRYDSSTLVAPAPGVPTGKSRLCLSCHDGTVALGDLQNPPAGNDLAAVFLGSGDRGFLDTDLSDDHPISFAYDATLFGLNPELADPAGIGLPLEDITGQPHLQCTTCHDPHEKDVAPFLRAATADGVLCTTCHLKTGWLGSTHESSTAAVAPTDLDNRRPAWVAATVAGNACLGCHTPHNGALPEPLALRAERLLAKPEENTCYGCHDADGPGANIQGDFAKLGGIHPVADPLYAGEHDATKVEDAASMPLHVECMDCHNPHTVTPGTLPMISINPTAPSDPNHSTPPAANALIQDVTGIDLNGNPTTSVTNQYELCFKCHGRAGQNTCGTDRCGAPQAHGMLRADMLAGDPLVTLVQVPRNIRDRVYSATSGLLSWHPIESNNSANNAEVPSITLNTTPGFPLNASTSLIYCTDCHNSDASIAALGGTGPNGPHGSTEEGLLADTYEMNVGAAASAATSRLCFKCHDEAIVLSNASFNKHSAHLNNRKGTCIKCHDPHGSHQYPRLINFLWWSDGDVQVDCPRQSGGGYQPCEVAYPTPTWVDGPNMTGACYLDCHGTGHAKTY
jgi:predicted CXXCH cytochrome family protein